MKLLRHLAARLPQIVGTPIAFLMALVLVVTWMVLGFVVGFSDAWLLWPSAIASVVTFLMAFSLQYTQNRDTRAIQLKLDEILRSSDKARSELIKLESLTDEELTNVETEIVALREESCAEEREAAERRVEVDARG